MSRKKKVKELPAPRLPSVKLPAGFKILANTEFSTPYEFKKKGDTLQGKFLSIKSVKYKNKMLRVMNVESSTDGRVYAVWESVQLRELFDACAQEKVKNVFIVYEGTQDVGQALPMKLFTAAASGSDFLKTTGRD